MLQWFSFIRHYLLAICGWIKAPLSHLGGIKGMNLRMSTTLNNIDYSHQAHSPPVLAHAHKSSSYDSWFVIADG